MSSERAIIRVLGEAAVTGQFIGIDFIKGDGSLRSMVCKVGPDALDRLGRDIITVFDVRAKGYRSFNINSVVYLTHNDTNTFGF
jgi:hypothetical protein